jgi:hypothetical protein
MSKFTEWLVENGHTSSEDKETIESELSAYEADMLYHQFINEGNEDD